LEHTILGWKVGISMLQIRFDEIGIQDLADRFPMIGSTGNFEKDLKRVADSYDLTVFKGGEMQVKGAIAILAASTTSQVFKNIVFAGKHEGLYFVLY
jgi:hypothetical protein